MLSATIQFHVSVIISDPALPLSRHSERSQQFDDHAAWLGISRMIWDAFGK